MWLKLGFNLDPLKAEIQLGAKSKPSLTIARGHGKVSRRGSGKLSPGLDLTSMLRTGRRPVWLKESGQQRWYNCSMERTKVLGA